MSDAFDRYPTRRAVMAGVGSAAVLGPAACARREDSAYGAAPDWLTLLGESEKGGRDYAPRVEGALPEGLRGALYRNGPGLFGRGDSRVKHLLDGDGLIQRLSFSDAGVRYQNAFVQTEKFVEEEKARKRLHATWTTRRPGGFPANIGGGDIVSQAGVTVYPVHGKILARDEVGATYAMDAETLDTLDAMPAGAGGAAGYKAHSKLDPESGEWILAGTEYGRDMNIHVAIYDPALKLKTTFAFAAPRQIYLHDFLATKTHLLFVLHPCFFNPFPFLAGMKSFTDSLSWRGGEGNVVAVVPRAGGEAKFFDATGVFMWHALNAYEDGEEIVADFVGYDEPDHFIGKDALLANIMRGKLGRAEAAGKIRRYRINSAKGALKEEILDEGNHEFPMIDERVAMTRQRAGYFTHGGLGVFNSGVKRLDYDSGAVQSFDFGPETHVGEPVFIARPDGGIDEGWFITEGLDGASKTSFFALFDAGAVEAGPLAKVWLDHSVPISFHGGWKEA